MPEKDKMMTARQVGEIFNMNEKSVRAHVRGIRIGRQFRYSRAHIMRAMGDGGRGPSPIRGGFVPDYRTLAWEAQKLWGVNERQALCDRKTDLLTSSVAGFLFEEPDGDVMSDAFVLYVRRNLPPPGGKTGEALRADILREASLRGLGVYF